MKETPRREDIQKSLFIQLIMMLATSASQQMGKLVNPLTKKVEVNLEGAQATIDLLEMLSTKTKGNLDRDEERLLKDTIMSLQLTYVETSQTTPPPQETGGSEAGKPETEAPPATGSSPSDDQPPRRFHKTYD